MVDYLLRSGAPPSYFDMPAVNQNASERRQAYEASMLERGAEPVIFDVPSLDWDFERLAFEEAMRLFKAGAPVGGTILCACDRVAFGVMAAACQMGISVGRLADLRVAGHDDHPLSQYACPSLTTVAQDVDRLATLSLERLMQGIADGANKNVGRSPRGPADHAQLGVGAKKLSLTRVARSERQGVAAGDLRRRARVIDRYRAVVGGSGGLERLDQLRRAADVAELARSLGEAIAHRRLRIVVGEGDSLHERHHRPGRA